MLSRVLSSMLSPQLCLSTIWSRKFWFPHHNNHTPGLLHTCSPSHNLHRWGDNNLSASTAQSSCQHDMDSGRTLATNDACTLLVWKDHPKVSTLLHHYAEMSENPDLPICSKRSNQCPNGHMTLLWSQRTVPRSGRSLSPQVGEDPNHRSNHPWPKGLNWVRNWEPMACAAEITTLHKIAS